MSCSSINGTTRSPDTVLMSVVIYESDYYLRGLGDNPLELYFVPRTKNVSVSDFRSSSLLLFSPSPFHLLSFLSPHSSPRMALINTREPFLTPTQLSCKHFGLLLPLLFLLCLLLLLVLAAAVVAFSC